MKIAVACDHGALELKNTVKAHLEKQGHQVQDFGTHTLDSCDYPDFAAAAAKAADDKAVAAQNTANTALANAATAQGEVDALETVVANNLSATNTAIDAAKQAAIADAKTETENQIAALDLQAISRVPAECSNENNYCALTTDGKKFVWEVIERDTSEFENGVLKMDGRTAVAGVEEAN